MWNLAILLFVLITTPGSQAEVRKLHILTSFLPIYCFTANVAGDAAEVENLLPPGIEPHDFQFSPRELKRIEAADVIVINGLGLEAWLDRVLSSGADHKIVVVASAGMSSEFIRTTNYPASTEVSNLNPHIWLDPVLAARMVTNILSALQKADPAHAADFGRNAERYVATLAKLDAELRAGLEFDKGRPAITYHDAFPYFARRYGLVVAGVIEQVPDVPPSPRHLAALAQTIRELQVRVIFCERGAPARLPEMMARDYHVSVAQLDTLETGELEPQAYEIGMKRNLKNLEAAWR